MKKLFAGLFVFFISLIVGAEQAHSAWHHDVPIECAQRLRDFIASNGEDYIEGAKKVKLTWTIRSHLDRSSMINSSVEFVPMDTVYDKCQMTMLFEVKYKGAQCEILNISQPDPALCD